MDNLQEWHLGKLIDKLFNESVLVHTTIAVYSQILFIQATIHCLTINKTENARHNETVIFNYILAVTQLATARVNSHSVAYCKVAVHT